MEPLKFIVIGSGWRSLFYHRIAEAYPEHFKLIALVCRTEEKAEHLRREYGIKAVTSGGEGLEERPDFVVVAVNKDAIFDTAREWALKGWPVLSETPAAMKLEDLKELWRLHKEEGARILTAEQYFKYPSFSAAIEVCRAGYLGDPYMVNISAVHDYHAASLIRRILNVGFQNVRISGKSFSYPIVETDSRQGLIEDGRIKKQSRVRLTFEFEKGKTAFYDFSGVQYHSKIRTRHLNIQGERGELDDYMIRYVDEENRAKKSRMMLEPFETGQGIREIYMGEKILYKNPFYELDCTKGLPQDETAIAAFMLTMRQYLQEGTEGYPFAEALQDAYIRILMEQAVMSGEAVHSLEQPWT